MSTDLRKPHFKEISETLSGKRDAVYKALADHPCTATELAFRMGWDKCSTRPRLSELLKAGLIEETGVRRNHEHEFRFVPLALAEQRMREADQPAFQLSSE